jgi:hypothetical protein
MNVNIGCLDKRFNKRNRAEIFADKNEAWAKHKARAKVMALKFKKVKKFWLAITENKQPLQEGFLPISFMKYDLQQLELFKIDKILEKEDFKVMGVNTDSLFVAHDQMEKLKAWTDDPKNKQFFNAETPFEKIGLWKYQEKKCRQKLIEQQDNGLQVPQLWTDPVEVFYPDDEKNWKTSKNYIDSAMSIMQAQNLMILSKYPGCGKTNLIKQFVKKKNPFNNQKEAMKMGCKNLHVATHISKKSLPQSRTHNCQHFKDKVQLKDDQQSSIIITITRDCFDKHFELPWKQVRPKNGEHPSHRFVYRLSNEDEGKPKNGKYCKTSGHHG